METGFTIKVLDKGFVRYIDHLGTDERICESARISYKAPSKGPEQDNKLLNYLYKNHHTSPFEQCNITFNIKMPIFVMRQFVRHRTFKLNEQSARYTEMADEYYTPKYWRKQDNINKQSSVDVENWNPTTIDDKVTATEDYDDSCLCSYGTYERLLKSGVAREMARMVLPVSFYTEIYVSCDLHNLLHFLNLRMDSHAQWEIQQYAKAMFEVVKSLYPMTSDIFLKNFYLTD